MPSSPPSAGSPPPNAAAEHVNPSQMRQTYELGDLRRRDVAADPLVQFDRWFEQARVMPGGEEVPTWIEPNAMTLSTVDAAGRVTSRIVLLKGVTDGGFVFYSNYGSEKARAIDDNANVSLCLHWPHWQRQIRINGTAAKTSRQSSGEYFQTRPRGSQIGAHASEQSAEVESREELQRRAEALEQQFTDADEIPLPDCWGGYVVAPRRLEFWQGRPSRLHDRLVYRRTDQDNRWEIVRLNP